MLFLLLLLMIFRRVRVLVEQVAALPRPPVEETARGAATPAAIVAGDILWYKDTEPLAAYYKLLVQSEQEISYCYRKCEMVSTRWRMHGLAREGKTPAVLLFYANLFSFRLDLSTAKYLKTVLSNCMITGKVNSHSNFLHNTCTCNKQCDNKSLDKSNACTHK